jgi:uncharacterized lipoprotein YajG
MPYKFTKHLFLAVALVSLSACAAKPQKPADSVTPTAPRDCDQPGQRDDTGRPVQQC